MKLSARNMLKGKVAGVERGTVMAKVRVDIGNGQFLTSLISRESVDDLSLKDGSPVYAIIKSTEVILATD